MVTPGWGLFLRGMAYSMGWTQWKKTKKKDNLVVLVQ